jgi:hypothetical protein
MIWLIADAILAGVLVGFAAGASPAPTGGNVATAVAAFLVGAVAAAGAVPSASVGGGPWAWLCFLFLVTLAVSYVVTNILRRQGKLKALGFRGPEKK